RSATRRIVAVERRTVSIAPEDFRSLEESELFLRLVEAGIVSLVRSRDAPFGLRAAALVGEAVVAEGVRLAVTEKMPGTLAALLTWSVPADWRQAAPPAPIGKGDELFALFARRFVEHVGYYVRHGRSRAYRQLYEESSRPRGKVDLRGTLRLRRRG